MGLSTYGAPKELTKVQLEDWIWGLETAIGPVRAIGSTPLATAATFEFSPTLPSKRAEIVPMIGDNLVCPPGMTEVCRGRVFIAGGHLKVGICRP